jgi:hypothetical protein
MLQTPKFWGILACMAALIAIFMFFLNINGTRQKAWQLVIPDLMEENASLKNENEGLKSKIVSLNKQNMSLKKYIDAYENNFIELKDAAGNCNQIESMLSNDLPEKLTKERFEIRQIYRQMLSEQKRWDQYQQAQYKNVLESTIEPDVIESQSLDLENQENMVYFLELESALKLHKRLIRDVRLFHDEIQYQKKQLHAQQEYELYDLKFKLGPFARVSALVDALQQAMSVLSAGIYQQEAVEVLDRIGDEFTKPIQQLYEQQQDTTETPSPVPTKYNYNFYAVFGKKLMDYSDSLTTQSSITLGFSAFGELDFFNRRLSDSLYDLYLVGQDEAINQTDLDLEELEQVLHSRH